MCLLWLARHDAKSSKWMMSWCLFVTVYKAPGSGSNCQLGTPIDGTPFLPESCSRIVWFTSGTNWSQKCFAIHQCTFHSNFCTEIFCVFFGHPPPYSCSLNSLDRHAGNINKSFHNAAGACKETSVHSRMSMLVPQALSPWVWWWSKIHDVWRARFELRVNPTPLQNELASCPLRQVLEVCSNVLCCVLRHRVDCWSLAAPWSQMSTKDLWKRNVLHCQSQSCAIWEQHHKCHLNIPDAHQQVS